ncbi:glycosyltransferase [Patescibacteria group bacterium]|nr:glycosyltransferase [Patescibacteria group bacterium]
MKIIYIANFRFPTEKAHGIQIAKMCEAFGKIGVDLELVVPKRGNYEDPFDFYGIEKNFSIKRIPTLNIFPSLYLGFVFSSFFFGLASFFYVFFKNRKDIIYSMDLDPISFLFIPFLCKPYFFDLHGPKKKNIFVNFLFKKINGIVTINEAVKKDLLENFNFLKDKIIVCPNGVDLEKNFKGTKEEARKKLDLKLDKKLVVYTGSFLNWKGIEIIIKSAQNLNDVIFCLVGGTEKDIKEKIVLPQNVKLISRRDFKEMPLWRAAADILVVTGTKKDKYSFFYTSPMKLFEYMGSKKPIIASRTPAIEQIVNEQEVFFHEPDDVQSFVDQVKFVFNNSNLSQKKVEIAYNKVKIFSWENRARKILEFIKSKI